MAIRNNRDMGFVDAMIDGGNRTGTLLGRLDSATPWETLAEPIAALSESTNSGPPGVGSDAHAQVHDARQVVQPV